MASTPHKVIDDALSLPADERLDLIERLLHSLNLPIDEQIERAWADEAERRVTDIDAGKTKLIPADDVFYRLRDKHGR